MYVLRCGVRNGVKEQSYICGKRSSKISGSIKATTLFKIKIICACGGHQDRVFRDADGFSVAVSKINIKKIPFFFSKRHFCP